MGGNGKHRRWRISFHRPSSAAKTEAKEPLKEYVCPISGSLMADPVVVASGQTFERVSVEVCRNLGFSWVLDDGSRADFSAVIPNLAIKSAILSWCDGNGRDHPRPPDGSSVEKLVRAKLGSQPQQFRVSERELLEGVAERQPVLFSHAATDLAPRFRQFYSSSSEESVVVTASPPTPLPLTTRPSCYSSSSSSSDITESETDPRSQNPEEEELVRKMKSNDVFEQEQAVISLRKTTRAREDVRVTLCTPRLLSALKYLIASRYSVVQTNAVAALVNLSLEKSNKVKIVRAGAVPILIDTLKGGFDESQEHAAGALFSLALEDENKMAIGVLGGLPPLMHALRSSSERSRQDAALALYHLTLVQSNRVKLVKHGAVPTLLSMVKLEGFSSQVLLILCNLAMSEEGRSAMLDSNAVGCLVEMLRRKEFDSEATRENCVATLYALSHGSMRFKVLAKEARAVDVLMEIEEEGTERAREKARRILQMMRGREDGEDEGGVDWEGILESGSLSRARNPVGALKNSNGINSSAF